MSLSAADFHESSSRRRYQGWQWLAMIGLTVAALALGCVGFARHFSAAGQPYRLGGLLYPALQLFVLEFAGSAGPVPWQLELARFLAPVVPAWALVKTAMVLFRHQLHALKLRRSRGHVVICGMGRKGLQLFKEFHRAGERVVAIERDEENPAIELGRELGALVLVGDAREPAVLAMARADRAKYVLAMSGDDGVNVDIALRCHALVKGQASTEPTTCVAHVVDLKLCNLFRQHRVFTETGDRFEVRLFNTFEASGRTLFSRHPLDRDQITREDPRAVHLVVIGFGQMGQSVLLQAAKTAHYANEKQLQATVVDLAADEKKRAFYNRYLQFDKTCEATFVSADAEDRAVLERIESLAADPARLATVAISLDSDSACLSYALTLAGRLGASRVPLWVRMSEETGLAALLEQPVADGAGASPVVTFGPLNCCCTRELLLGQDLDTLARAIHESFVCEQLAQGRSPSEPSLQPWDRLIEQFKDSNRQQADHIPVKLRAIGCCLAPVGSPGPAVGQFTGDEVELLARMEHRRWCAERFLAGWSYGEVKDVFARKSPYLCDWEALTGSVQDYDRNMVRAMPAVVGRIGQAVYRAMPESPPGR